jgi:MraZ protein
LDGCLALYPEAAFEMLGQRLAAHSPAARDVRDYSRLFYSQAACVTPDRQWRFRVPPELAAWAELAGEVTLVGVRDHLEIWSTEKWQRYVSRCDSQHDQLAEAAFVGAAPAGGAYQPPIAAPGEEETATPPRPR